MNPSQVHLALTHVPVILSIVGLVILLIGIAQKNQTIQKTAFSILVIGGLFTIPVYLTGEGTEEIIEQLPGVSESFIEEHEEMGKNAFVAATIVALFSLAGLLFNNSGVVGKLLRLLVLLTALVSAGIMTVTAHLGGQIRHTEMRTGAPQAGEKNNHTPLPEAEEE